jgi:hypothetical protein
VAEWAHLAPLALILAVLREKAAEEVATATSHMDQWPFLSKAQAGGHDQHQGDCLDEQGPFPQVASDDEATQNGLYLKQQIGKQGEMNHCRPWLGKRLVFL